LLLPCEAPDGQLQATDVSTTKRRRWNRPNNNEPEVRITKSSDCYVIIGKCKHKDAAIKGVSKEMKALACVLVAGRTDAVERSELCEVIAVEVVRLGDHRRRTEVY